MDSLSELLKPKLVSVQFDTAKLKNLSVKDDEFDSELEDNIEPITGGVDATGADPGGGFDAMFVIDNKGGPEDDKRMQIDLPKDHKLVKTHLSDLRPSLYISSDVASTKAKLRDLNLQWAEDVLLKKSILKDDSEKERSLPTKRGKKAEKKHRQAEREKDAGASWYSMAKPELTAERKRDLELLKMRKVLDTKTFYKKNDIQQLPKYFEVGTVLDNATDFYSDRVPKKMRKQTLVDELLSDEQFKKLNKKKYREALEKQQYTSKKAYLTLKRMRRKEEAKMKKKQAST